MSVVNLAQLERELDSAARTQPRDSRRYSDLLEQAIQACANDPVAEEVFDAADLLLDLCEEYQYQQRWESALATADAAVAAGLRMAPDARCLRAEILVRAGRSEEAAPIWAQVRADTPEDVWVYNNAGLEYAAAGDDETALGWLTEGLELALRSGDPEQLVDQLAQQRAQCLQAVNRGEDELQRKARDFAARSRSSRSPLVVTADATSPAMLAVREMSQAAPRAGARVVWGWLPASEYPHAVHMWPDLTDSDVFTGPDGGLRPHADYCRGMQPSERRCRRRGDRDTDRPTPAGSVVSLVHRARTRTGRGRTCRIRREPRKNR